MLHGEERLRLKLAKVEASMIAAAPAAAMAGARPLAVDMAARAPIGETGDLSGTVGITMDGPRARVGSQVPYARFVQGGTRNMAARPYMTEAADQQRQEVSDQMATVLRATIRRAI